MTSYFKSCDSLVKVKKCYKELALQNHPDLGGDNEIMTEINNQFNIAYSLFKNESSVGYEEFRQEFYTENGWKGKNYSRSLTTKEITALTRAYVKAKFNDCRFGLTSTYNVINLTLKESPFDLFQKDELLVEYLEKKARSNSTFSKSYTLESFKKDYSNGISNLAYMSKWDDKEYLNSEVYNLMKEVIEFIQSYNYDDSDGRIDYFNTNFYFYGKIGNFEKPYKKVERVRKVKSISVL